MILIDLVQSPNDQMDHRSITTTECYWLWSLQFRQYKRDAAAVQMKPMKQKSIVCTAVLYCKDIRGALSYHRKHLVTEDSYSVISATDGENSLTKNNTVKPSVFFKYIHLAWNLSAGKDWKGWKICTAFEPGTYKKQITGESSVREGFFKNTGAVNVRFNLTDMISHNCIHLCSRDSLETYNNVSLSWTLTFC